MIDSTRLPPTVRLRSLRRTPDSQRFRTTELFGTISAAREFFISPPMESRSPSSAWPTRLADVANRREEKVLMEGAKSRPQMHELGEISHTARSPALTARTGASASAGAPAFTGRAGARVGAGARARARVREGLADHHYLHQVIRFGLCTRRADRSQRAQATDDCLLMFAHVFLDSCSTSLTQSDEQRSCVLLRQARPGLQITHNQRNRGPVSERIHAFPARRDFRKHGQGILYQSGSRAPRYRPQNGDHARLYQSASVLRPQG